MKRIISLYLCVMMLLSLAVPAFAASDELADLILSAKNVLEIPEEYTEFESSKQENAGEVQYSFMWTTEDGEERIYCDILSSGEILSYEKSFMRQDSSFVSAAFENEKYLELSEEWIKKVNPKYAGELNFEGTVSVSAYSPYVSVSLMREFSGIPVYGNNVNLSLDKTTGEVLRMHTNFDISEKVESAEKTIGDEVAKEKLFELFAPTLKYKKVPGETRAILVFEPKSRGDMIAAADGEKFEVTYLGNDAPMMKDEAAEEEIVAGGSNSSLNRAELEAVEELSKLISKEEIKSAINKLAGTAVARYNLQSVNYTRYENKDGEKFYHARAILSGGAKTYGEVILDAKTGELLNLYSYDGNLSSIKTKHDEGELRRTAERFAKTFAPEEYEKTAIRESYSSGRYLFTERVDGIEYEGNNISVFVNEKNGKVMSYSKNWEDGIEYDAAEGLISELDAWEKFVGEDGLEKYYIADGIQGYRNRKVEEFRLIYRLSDDIPTYIDAKTGEPLGWDLKPEKREAEFKLQDDLKGHFAEASVKKLFNNGVILAKKEKFAPNEAITLAEAVYLLFMFERGYYTEPTEEIFESYMREAKARKIIKDDADGNALAYRDEAACVIVNLLGYKKAAEIPDIYKTGFADEGEIAKENLGGVAIAKGLGIINGSGNGLFAPRRAVTRGEFAVMLANSYGK